jgi:hypothetical protein
MINGNMIGGSAPLKTVILTDENGNEVTGVVTDSEVIFTATDNDVREGMVYASDSGVSTGTKDIPAYRTTQGFQAIPVGSSFSIPLSKYNKYDYTKLQCVIAPFNTTMSNSVATDKVSINDCVYVAGTVDKIADVTKNHNTKSIDLNITNTSEKSYIIRYFTYKEEI